MTNQHWMKYVGLPYRLCADPEKTNATDCIHLVFRVIESGGGYVPELKKKWYLHMARNEMNAIMDDWYSLTEQTFGPEDYAMTLLSRTSDFAIAVFVDNGLLSVRPNVGVTWTPAESLKPMNYRRFCHE